jgi:hypothetical protein
MLIAFVAGVLAALLCQAARRRFAPRVDAGQVIRAACTIQQASEARDSAGRPFTRNLDADDMASAAKAVIRALQGVAARNPAGVERLMRGG